MGARSSAPAADDRLRPATEFLEQDPLRNIVLLKTLFYYPHLIRCRYHAAPGGAGVLLLLPGDASAYDRKNYPGTDYVVFLAAPHPAHLPELAQHVPRGKNLLFKLNDPRHQPALRSFFSMSRVTAFVSYTAAAGRMYTIADDVTASGTPDDRCLDMYAGLGHSRAEVEPLFANGQARSFTAFQNLTPAASCFTFPNYGRIHEIGGVYTDPGHRRSGLGRKVVEAALHHLGNSGFLARYQVQEDNRASTRLAESIGLTRVVTYEHWRHIPH
jgi:ribosomal protein S18 acetylase RimI-like enzyme